MRADSVKKARVGIGSGLSFQLERKLKVQMLMRQHVERKDQGESQVPCSVKDSFRCGGLICFDVR